MQEFRSRLSLYAYTDSGIGGRSENQDDMAMLDTSNGCLAVVCDGMGGGPGGKTASYIAKMAIVNTVRSAPANTDRERLLRIAMANAQSALEKKCAEVPQLKGMGSTAVAVLVNETSAIVAHIGDSRFYEFRKERQLFKTEDHSLVAEMIARKSITEEQARTSSQSNIITRGLGGLSNNTPDIDTVTFQKGDRFVLCTDGIWGIMPSKDLTTCLTAPMPLCQIVEKLQSEVDRLGQSKGGKHDNHTIIIMELGFNSLLHAGMTSKVKVLISMSAIILLMSIILNIILICYHSEPTTTNSISKGDIEMLKAYKLRYEALINGNNTAIAQTAKELIAENDSLREIIANQEQQIKELHSGATKLTVTTNQEKTATSKQDAKKQGVQKKTPKQLVDEIDKMLVEMAQSTDKEQYKCSNNKDKKRKEIITRLGMLDDATQRTFTNCINKIIVSLDIDKGIFIAVEKSNGTFASTRAAIKKIERIQSEIRKQIKSKL